MTENNKLIEDMVKSMENSPTGFMYALDSAIKQSHIGGSSIDSVQRYFIKCLLDSNGTVLTEPVYFKPL